MPFAIITNRYSFLTYPEGPCIQCNKDTGEQSSPSHRTSGTLVWPAHGTHETRKWSLDGFTGQCVDHGEDRKCPIALSLLSATIPVTVIVVGCSCHSLLSDKSTEYCLPHGCHLGLHAPLLGQGQQRVNTGNKHRSKS